MLVEKEHVYQINGLLVNFVYPKASIKKYFL